MKKKLLFRVCFCILFGVVTLPVLAQKPEFNLNPKQIVVPKKADTLTEIQVVIQWKGADFTNKKIELIVENLSDKPADKVLETIPAAYFWFGEGLSNVYPITLKFLKDDDIVQTQIIRMTLKEPGASGEVYDHVTFLYQYTGNEKKNVVDNPFQKSIAEVKNDIKELKRQILEGDTSVFDLGKFIIRDTIIATSILGPDQKRQSYNVDSEFSYNLLRHNKSGIKEKLRVKVKKNETPEIRIPIYDKDGNLKTEMPLTFSLKKMKDVKLNITEGFIEYIRATTTDNTTFVFNQPIPVVAFDTKLDTKVYSIDKDQFVFLGDILELDTYKFYNYFPDDAVYELENNDKGTKRYATLRAFAGLGSLVDFRLYTDLLGTFGEQPNGLVQLEANSKFPFTAVNWGRVHFFDFLQPFFKLSKLDTKFDTVAIAPSAIGQDVNKMELFQRSFLNLGLKANIMKVNWRPKNGILVNIGYNFSSGNISMGKDTLTKGILHMPFAEFALSAQKLKNFGFDAEVRYGFMKLNENKYFNGSGWDNIMSISTSMFFFPTTRSQDKFFIRFVNYLNFEDRSSDFYQLQFGYSLNFRLGKSRF